MPSFDIIIVNWNAGRQLFDCLKSIVNTKKDRFELSQIVVLDNASKDGSLNGLDALDLPLRIIRNKENRGFGAACNQGAKESQADYLLFLNPDVKLFENSLIIPLVFMERSENKKIGIAGIQLTDDSGEVARTCARFPTPVRFFTKIFGLVRLFPKYFPSYFMREWDHSETRVVDQVIGAFFLVRHSIFESLSGFDKRFFVYFEEVDFSYRARQAGWRSIYLSTAQAYHKGGGTSEKAKPQRLFYSLRSRILYSYKHFNKVSASMVFLITLFVEPITRLSFAIFVLSFEKMKETIKGYKMLFRFLPKIFKIIREDKL